MLRLLRQKNAHYSLQKSLNNNSKVISLFSTKVSSNDVDHEQIKKLQTQSMIHEISEMQLNASKEVVPWFLNNMPKAYFRHVPDEARTKHLMAISALKQMGSEEVNLQIESTNDHGRADVTVISKTKSNHQEELVEQIMTTVGPPNHILSRLGMFNSKDENIHLNIFTYESEEHQQLTATLEDGKVIMSWGDDIIAGKRPQPTVTGGVKKDFFTTDAWKNYFSKCTPAYVTQANPEHFIIQRHLFEQVKGTHSTIIDASDYYGEKLPQERPTPKWLCVASGNIDPESLLKTCTRIINSSGMELFRAHMDTVDGVPPFNTQQDYVTMLRLLVTPKRDGRTFESHPELLVDLISDLKRAKWLDDKVIDLGLVQHPSIGLDRAEVIWALCTMLHGPMVKDRNGTHFASSKSIVDMLSSTGVWIEYAEKIADLFLDKFRPDSPISEAEYNQREAELFASINSLNSTPAKLVLNNMLNAVKSTLRTNFFKDGRYALSLRLDPTIVMTDDEINKEKKEIPFGTVFVFGRFFSAFHNRFRDIARGGMRLVTPSSVDQHALESARHFDEVYGLSFAQQLKNKDIPEGGSKAVVLIDSPSVPADQKESVMRMSVKGFTDALLDLIVEDSVKGMVDYLKHDELIYLGPDEQVTPYDIEWICARAAQRGYPIPAAFMSSKPKAGINHKVYGVTSEGVAVHLRTALEEFLKIDPTKEPFTIKITGGPDGDVGGNLLKIMNREYPDTCKVVGIADGFGVAEDPEGLDMKELVRLFEEEKSISHFNSSKLSSKGIVMTTDNEEGIQRRNTMHFRVKADAFVPAGGRPNTINKDNWHNFLDDNGKPSSPLIVEGANIFTTVEARELLFEKGGVAIVKDSSANKCGVITSSDEVACSMLLSEQEFLDNKEELVADVVKRIRNLAELEAKLLFREYKNYPGALPHFSQRISSAINVLTDAIAEKMKDKNQDDEIFKNLAPLLRANLPDKLAEMALDRVPTHLPIQYQRNAIASTLASAIVYAEGIHFVEAQANAKQGADLADIAYDYYMASKAINELAAKVESNSNDAADLKKTVDLLKKGGVRTLLGIY